MSTPQNNNNQQNNNNRPDERWLDNYWRWRDNIKDPATRTQFTNFFDKYIIQHPTICADFFSDIPERHEKGRFELMKRFTVLKQQFAKDLENLSPKSEQQQQQQQQNQNKQV